MSAAKCEGGVQRWMRFIVGGVINTGLTYLVYLVVKLFLSYQAAYLFAYSTGILFSYYLNSKVVFKVQLSWRGLFFYPVAYMAQYFLSMLMLGALVEFFEVSDFVAPLIVTIAMIPLTYLLIEFVLNRGGAMDYQHSTQAEVDSDAE